MSRGGARRSDWRTRRPRAGGGFTLVELAGAMVVVAILAAAAVPTLRAARDTRRSIAAHEARLDLAYARERAMATGMPCWVRFDVPSRTWSLLEGTSSSGTLADATPVLDPGTGRPWVRDLAAGALAGVTLGPIDFDGGTVVGFDWLGRPLRADATDLRGVGRATVGGRVVEVVPGTGLVRQRRPEA